MIFFEFLLWVQHWCKEQGYKLECVVINRQMIARGYVYLVEFEDKYYLLINTTDFQIAVSWFIQTFPLTEMTELGNSYNGTPIVEDADLTNKVVCGIYRLVA